MRRKINRQPELLTNQDYALATIIIGPIVEEITFRWTALSALTILFHLSGRLFGVGTGWETPLAVIVLCYLFMKEHYHKSPSGQFHSFLSGLVLSFIALQYGVVIAVLVHSIHNGLAIVLGRLGYLYHQRQSSAE